MKSLIVVFALMALSTAEIRDKRGLLELGHGPTLLQAAPILTKSLATPIIHAGPVVTRVFEPPPLPLIRGDGPIVTGPLITRGIGPHILGSKGILSAPTILSAPIISKQILTHAPLTLGTLGLGHGYGW